MDESTGRFVWYELLTPNVDAAKAFYGAVVGWRAQAAPGPMDYTLFSAGELMVAGLMVLPEEARTQGAPPHWLGYLGVNDVDRAAGLVAELGGKVLRPAQDIPEVGRFAVVADPQGAALALFTPKGGPPPRTGEPGPGEVAWHELYTTDYQAAWTFYTRLAGWQHTESFSMGPELGDYFMFRSADGRTRGGMCNVARAHGFPPYWCYYFGVPDVAEAAKRVQSLGGVVMNGPMEVPGGDQIVQAKDPQGALFALYTPKAAQPA